MLLTKRKIPSVKMEVIQTPVLGGSSDVRSAESLFFASQVGMRLKKLRITMPSGSSKVRVEPGALYYMNGDLQIKASTGGGVGKAMMRKMMSGESFFVNEIHGKGEIYLEPTFGHFILVILDDDDLIVDKSMFYAGLGDLSIGSYLNKVSSGLLGGEGFFQTKISGSGIVALFSPVPQKELHVFQLKESKLSVDGNFALMRMGKINFRTEKSSKSWIATSVSGEGLLQTFEGTGIVWVAPTQGVYEKLAMPGGLAELARVPGARATNT